MKILICILLLILISIPVFGMRTCGDINEPNSVCEIITPVIACSTYDIYNSTHELAIDDGAMGEIGDTGVYTFNFSQNDSGTHKIILCDNTTATIEVAEYSAKIRYDTDLTNFSTIREKVDDVLVGVQSNTTFLDASMLNNFTNIITNQSNIKLAIDAANIGIPSNTTSILIGIQSNTTFLSTNMQNNFTDVITNQSNIKIAIDSVSRGLSANTSYLEGNISTVPAAVWNYSVRNLTSIAFEIFINWNIFQDYVWNATSRNLTAGIPSEDADTIANATFQMIIQNKTEVYHNDSLGYPTYDVIDYKDGVQVNRSYNYYPDNITIKNETYARQ